MRILDWGHMAVVVFNHLDRGAHLLGEEIHNAMSVNLIGRALGPLINVNASQL